MDVEEANKFINSLVKNLQVLCHGHVNFNNSIQVIGHLYLNVDSQTNIDYIVNEKVCKNDNSSTMFVSNSYHSEPKGKVNKGPESQPAPDKSNDPSSEQFNTNSSQNNFRPLHNLNQTNETFSLNKKRKVRMEKQYIIHPPKVFKPPTEVSPVQQPCSQRLQSDFMTNDKNLFHNSNQHSTSTTIPTYNLEGASQSRLLDPDPVDEESKPFQVIPTVDMEIDLSRVKAEPLDPDEDIESTNCSSDLSTQANSFNHNDNNNGDNSVVADDMCSEDYLIGIRDKTLGLYPTGIHQSSDLASSSSFNLTSSSTAAVGSSSYYNSKNSPVTMKKREDDLPYGCKVCEKKFTFQTSLRRHIREKHLNIRFICPHCGMTFTQKVSLFNHVEYRCKGPNPVTFMEKRETLK